MRKTCKLFALAVAALVLASLCAPALAAEMTDIKGHWCEDRIAAWVSRGIMDGYPDGTFKPEGDITRAEFVKITNRAFGFYSLGSVPFSDVKNTDWFYEDVRAARYFGYINGYPDNTFRPNGNITRQEAAKIISTIMGLAPNNIAGATLTDYMTGVDEWARGYVGAVYANKIMGSYSDGSFKGRQKLTRAECVYSLWNAVEAMGMGPKVSDLTVKQTEYNPKNRETVKNLTVDYSGDVDISNLNVEGNVYITSKISNRNVTLKDCKISGTIFMDYGNLKLDGVTAGKIDADDLTANRTITLVGASSVGSAQTNRSIIIDQAGLKGGEGIENLSVGGSYSARTVLKGVFPRVYTQRTGQTIMLASGTIKELEASHTNTEVTLGTGATLEYAYISGSGSRVWGPGTVNHAYVDASGVSFQRKPAKLSGPYNPSTSGDYKLSFTVKEASSSKALVGAEIKLDEYMASGKTASGGVLEFARTPNKTISFTVSMAGYKDYSGTVTMNGGTKQVDVLLTPSGEFTASLTVVDSATGKPITGIYGYLTSFDNRASSPSDSNGRIFFEGLGSTTYSYKIVAPGYVSETGTFVISNKDNAITAAIKMQKTKVTLTVFAEADQRTQIRTFEYYIPGVTSGYVKADANGSATIEGLPADSSTAIRVRALTSTGAQDYSYDEGSVSAIPADSKTATAVKCYLISGATYTYSVTVYNWDNSSTVSNVTVTLSNGLWSRSATTASGGVVQITGVPESENYTMTVSSPGYTTVVRSAVRVNAGNLSTTVNLAGTRTVSLTVTRSGVPLSSTPVTLKNTATRAEFSGTTNASGVVQIANVPDGEYEVEITHSAYMIDPAASTIRVGPSAVFSLPAVDLEVSFSLSFIVDESSAALPAGSIVKLTVDGGTDSYTKTITGNVSEQFTLKRGTYVIEVAGFSAMPEKLVITRDSADSTISIKLTTIAP